jgi:hypothetical protein
LQHYGFIVLEKYGSLGVDGKGKAPLWRLTELGSVATDERPTKDFLRWDGVVFESQDSRPPCPYPPNGKKRLLVVKQVMRTTGGTPKASPLCTTGGTLSDKSAETEGTGVFPTGVQSAPTGGTGFCFPSVHYGGNTSDGDEHQLACRLLGVLRGP